MHRLLQTLIACACGCADGTFAGEVSSAGETALDDRPTKSVVKAEEQPPQGSELPAVNGGGGASGINDGNGGPSKREPVAAAVDGGARKRSRFDPRVATTV